MLRWSRLRGKAIAAPCLPALLLLMSAAAGCARPAATVDVVGSDTMVSLAQVWAEAFHRLRPRVSVPVSGGGSGVGIAALLNGYADVALASRPMRPPEWAEARRRGLSPQERVVGWDGLALIVHPENPVRAVTLAQAADLFSGRTAGWQAPGAPAQPVVVITRESTSGTQEFFRAAVMGSAAVTPGALKLPSSQFIHDTVARTPGAVGYVGLAYVTPAVRPLAVARTAGEAPVLPSPAAVAAGRYPLRRPLLMYTARPPAGALSDWVEFVTGPAGQQLLTTAGFVPAAAPGR